MPEPTKPEDQTIEITPDIQAMIDKAVEKSTEGLRNEISAKDRTITGLKKDLEKSDPKSVEDRLAALESRAVDAERRADTTEAFSKAGLSNGFRELFNITDPVERAEKLADLLAERDSEIRKEIASEFSEEPGESRPGKSRKLSKKDLEGMTPKEINDAYAKGLIEV